MRKDGGIAPLPTLTFSLQKSFCSTWYGHTGLGFHLSGQFSIKRAAYTHLSLLLHFTTWLNTRAFGAFSQQVIKEEKLQENSQEVGTYLLLKLAKLRDEFEIIGDVRGKGLMIGIEMVKDKVGSDLLLALSLWLLGAVTVRVASIGQKLTSFILRREPTGQHQC